MNKLETGIMLVFWNEVFERLKATSALLQAPDQDVNSGCALFKSLHGYIQTIRFSEIEAEAKILTGCEGYQQQTARNRKRNTNYDHFSGSSALGKVAENLTPKKKKKCFEIKVFNTIIDNLLSALATRMEAYYQAAEIFGILRQLKSVTAEEILKKISFIVKLYRDDLEESLGNSLNC